MSTHKYAAADGLVFLLIGCGSSCCDVPAAACHSRIGVACCFHHHAGASADLAARVASVEGNKSPDAFLASWLSMFPVDLRSSLRRVAVPVLLLAAEHDPITPLPHLAAIHALVPSARLVQLAGAGHFSNEDHPAEFNAELYAFLQSAAQ